MEGMQNSISRLSSLPFNDLIPTSERPLNRMRRFLYLAIHTEQPIKSASCGENNLNAALCVRSLAFTIESTLTKMTWIIRYPWYGSGNVSARNSINCFFWKNWSVLLLGPLSVWVALSLALCYLSEVQTAERQHTVPKVSGECDECKLESEKTLKSKENDYQYLIIK